MNAKEVIKKLRVRPFQPFVLVTSAGERHTVRHPENAIVAEGGVIYVFQPSRDPEAQAQSPDIISLLHVTAMEPVREAAA